MGSATNAAILLLLAAALTLTTTTTSAPISGLDTFLTQQIRHDPQASNDSFLSLSSSLLHSLSLTHHHPPSISSLLSLKLSVPVTVKLVGSSFPNSAPSLLQSYLSAAISSDQFHIITPFSSQTHDLSLTHSLNLDVSLASSSLSTTLFDAVKSEIDKATSSLRTPLTSIPYSSIDQIIKHDFEKEKPVEGVYIYLLNLGSQSKPYAYNYGFGDSSPAFTKCLGCLWTGKERYLWVDLGLGPVDYGPALSGRLESFRLLDSPDKEESRERGGGGHDAGA